jgi:hypothetical protein
MAADAYQGHVSYGAFKMAAQNPADVAPADSPTYDWTQFANQPGAAARANFYPRSDGQAAPSGAR